MVGSPNYIFMVYDADQSTFEAPRRRSLPGSVAIEDLYESYYTLVGEPYDDAAFSGRSDYQAFIDAGIPSGGLFTGAEEVKTAEQEAIWGGTAGEQFDPCYHLACDTIDNVDLHALEVNSDLIAFAMLTYAYSTESVNGVAGQAGPGPAADSAGARLARRAPLPPGAVDEAQVRSRRRHQPPHRGGAVHRDSPATIERAPTSPQRGSVAAACVRGMRSRCSGQRLAANGVGASCWPAMRQAAPRIPAVPGRSRMPVSATSAATSAILRLDFWLAIRSRSNACSRVSL